MRADLLREIVDPVHTAVVTTGVQRGNVNRSVSALPALADEVGRTDIVAAMARVCNAARSVGVRVLHCTIENRPDGAGGTANTRIYAHARKLREAGARSSLEASTDGAKLPPELGPAASDIVVSRLHGLTPFPSTPLDQILRNLGITTVIATGISLNINVMGLVLNAADLGYQVVLVRDAVAGVPAEYAQSVIDHSLSLVATVVTVDELLAFWSRPANAGA